MLKPGPLYQHVPPLKNCVLCLFMCHCKNSAPKFPRAHCLWPSEPSGNNSCSSARRDSGKTHSQLVISCLRLCGLGAILGRLGSAGCCLDSCARSTSPAFQSSHKVLAAASSAILRRPPPCRKPCFRIFQQSAGRNVHADSLLLKIYR